MKKLGMIFSKILHFLSTEIWQINLKTLPRMKSFFIKQLRIVVLAVRGFDEDKCRLRASALTFFSLLSFAPIIALAFGIAQGFGFEKLLERQLYEKFPGQDKVLGQMVGFAHAMLENTKGGMIAGIGLIILLWTVIKMLGHIERSFNEVWEISEGRSIGRKFSDYLSIILIAPVLVIVSSSMTVFIKTQIEVIAQRVTVIGLISPIIFSAFTLLPYIMIWTLFTFIYIIVPNTKVNFSSGFLAGIVAGTVFQISQLLYISFQVGVAKYNAIYGSFAALPLFLMWLQFSWLIVLFGAEISFAHQNVDTYEFETDFKRISFGYKKLLALLIVHLIVKKFTAGQKPLNAAEISHKLEIPVRLVRQILHELVQSSMLSETRTEDEKTFSFQPACDISDLTIKRIIDAIENYGTNRLPVAQTQEFAVLSESLQAFEKVIAQSPENRYLKDI